MGKLSWILWIVQRRVRKRWKEEAEGKSQEMFYIATLLMLKMEEGTVSQEMQAVSRNWKGRKLMLPLGVSGRLCIALPTF